ncbi:Z1 domain-containing protein [Dysgonomonas sp.]
MTDIKQIIAHCRLLIGEQTAITDADIDSAINKIKLLYPNIDEVLLKAKLAELYTLRVEPFQILQGKDRRNFWLNDFKAENNSEWKFWERYKSYLEIEEGYAPDVIRGLDELTDKILDNTFNPRLNNIQLCKKGLVVGQVQSGKTSNFTGLVCKAADAGFNLIIVFAGILDDLRSQTQTRLDKGFLGFSTNDIKNIRTSRDKIGVGYIDNTAIAHSLTTVIKDFGVPTARALDGINIFRQTDPILLVVKKNGRILNNLYNWLQERDTNIKSVMIIDDEADNASINTNKEDFEPTAINRNIRNLLSLFKRSAYVGYTATPFANIFISPREEEDLFPRDFIINIPTPPHYIGPEKIFGTSIVPDETNDDLLPVVFPISDYTNFVKEKHKIGEEKNIYYDDIPESLKTAVKCFIITCAIRIARGQGSEHNSMLVHISRFKAWQNRIKELVEELFNYYKHEIEANDPTILEEFREILEEDTKDYKSYKTITTEIKESSFTNINQDIFVHSWAEIKPLLYKAVNKIEVKALNGSSGDSLVYEKHPEGHYVIAIGGNKLSRGLTLYGLSVSYFLRASKMYDTLMQMGRWFGYRPGYVDLCRLYTSSELNNWFGHITIASEELREEFNYLAELGGTPDNYALKVRTSPGLLITSPLKMREATDIQVSWAGRLIETYALPRDKGSKISNLIETDKFIASLGQEERLKSGDYLWRGVNSQVICDYFSKFKIAESMKKRVDLDLIIQYIQNLDSNLGELKSWRVVVRNVSEIKAKSTYTFSNGLSINCGIRTRSTESGADNDTYYIKRKHILGGEEDEFIDLRDDNYRMTDRKILDVALERTIQVKQENNKSWDKKYPAREIVRQEFRPRTNPLLIIYPLNPKYSNVLDTQGNEVEGTTIYDINDDPFIGFAVSFPSSSNSEGMTYRINRVAEFAETEDLFNSQDDNTYDEY